MPSNNKQPSVKSPSVKPPCVITIGNFDGVHKGHIALINTSISFAHDKKYRQEFLNTHQKLAQCYASFSDSSPNTANDLEARIITFSPHPAHILSPKAFTPLMSDDSRLFSLKVLGADHVSILPFHKAIAEQSCEDFCIQLVQNYNMKMLFIGYDFKMGCDKGGLQILEEIGNRHGFCVHALPPISIENPQNPASALIVSSTHIRKALQNGDIELATKMLGKYFHITGIVEHGAKRGADLLGFPTANLREEARIVPKNGVYVSLCKILIPQYEGRVFLGVTNIGYNPTFGEFAKSIETHILDFNGNLYDLPMEISFTHFIRDEIKFNSIEELVKQIEADIRFARKVFEKL